MDDYRNNFLASKVIPAFFSVLWFFAMQWYRLKPYWGLGGLVFVFALVFFWAYRHRRKMSSQISFWMGIGVFMITVVSGISFVSSTVIQHLLILATAVVMWIYLRQAIRPASAEIQGRLMSFVMTWAYWSGMVAIISLGIYTVRPWWLLTAMGAILYPLVAVIVWLDSRATWSQFKKALPWVVLLGAEITLVAWWLPISIFSSSVVAATIGMLFVHLCRHIWLDSWSSGRGRRYIILSLVIIIAVIISARWV